MESISRGVLIYPISYKIPIYKSVDPLVYEFYGVNDELLFKDNQWDTE